MDKQKLNTSAKEAEKLDILKKELIAKFKRAQKKHHDLSIHRKEEYKPITAAIENLIEKEASNEYKPITTAIENLEKKVETQLVPFQRSIAYKPMYDDDDSDNNDDDDDQMGDEESDIEESNETIKFPSGAQHSTPVKMISNEPNAAAEAFEGEEHQVDESKIYDTSRGRTAKQMELGKIATKFLPRASDKSFGLYYNSTKESYMIGNTPVEFDKNDIILGTEMYRGTPGLWRLLTYEKAPNEQHYTLHDLDIYEKILIDTESMFQGNNKITKKPKSSRGDKWTSLVKGIWKKYIDENKTEHCGSGILEFNNNPIEYKYIDNLNELITRLHYIYSQEKAGNNNFHNEKVAILNFFYDRLEEIIDSPKGIEYLIRFVSAVPTKFLKGAHVGSGLFNSILKKIPFEIHAPGYNFLGPGTNLDSRLQKGHVGVNKLDEAAKEHDIFYRDNPKTEDRHRADKVLEEKAWSRLKSKDAGLNERAWALATGTAMKLKQTFGMGIEPQLRF